MRAEGGIVWRGKGWARQAGAAFAIAALLVELRVTAKHFLAEDLTPLLPDEPSGAAGRYLLFRTRAPPGV